MTTFASTDPSSGRVVRRFETMTDQELDATVTQTHHAFGPWSRLSIHARAELLRNVAQLYRENADELAALTGLEVGKPVTQALGEVGLAADIYDFYATHGPTMIADEAIDRPGGGSAVVQTAPIGTLLGIMPWNFPYYQVARFAAPNLLLGNVILLKHAENCPQQALRIEALFAEAGLPAHVYSNVLATTGQVAMLIGDPRVRGVSLTGSERAGRAVGELAGKHIKKCVLELGGSDPLIVLPDADVAAAAEAALTGRLFNAGQACTAVKRVIVHDTVWDDFVSAFIPSARKWKMGDPKDRDTVLGPLASVTARDRLADQVRDAVDKGARVLLGGEVPQREGAYFPVTVITDVTSEMRAYHEELFGPVAVLYRVRSTEEAVAMANDTPYGLGATVFCRDTVEANEVAGRLEVGMVGINMAVRRSPELPFGGVKNSGVGRELGRFGIEEFANKKLKVEPAMAG